METESNARLIAAVATVLLAVGLFLFLYTCPVWVAAAMPEREKGEIVLAEPEAEEEFVEVLEPVADPVPTADPAAAKLDEPKVEESQPAVAPGTDLRNSGPQGEKPPVVTQKAPSPVKEKKEETPKPTGQQNKPKTDETAEINRKINNDVASAFGKGKNNAATSNTADKGQSGSPSAQGSTTGTGHGRVGGGWIIPQYGAVKSTVTGSVNATVKIDKTGKVVSVVVTGGNPPAATSSQVKAAVEREIRAHKFSHPDRDNAEPATAYITYTFR